MRTVYSLEFKEHQDSRQHQIRRWSVTYDLLEVFGECYIILQNNQSHPMVIAYEFILMKSFEGRSNEIEIFRGSFQELLNIAYFGDKSGLDFSTSKSVLSL